MAVAARLTYLYAFINFDDDQHRAAQRFSLISLSLARGAGDATASALALRSLSSAFILVGFDVP
ncbi:MULTISPECIES: hypothetical protein [Kitasatospora]|uniref:Uncharacterized protein n=1 Tax=Kitasatospora setae (strain ATCC 33774 / DSM 43861 / JCM 3304 / KCC A-0304 / NBRC 14216 / KM-6054) TaxID=452652 RepID=E4MZ14_KITSK|nr:MULTISPECIES: hypothetical protein [Kitasatospora]BAJ25907.1 hypothetical protein KSE_00550t [Kitasatospora setae KM-6054]BAJ33371.1 hypothetical protein KSE_76190t [Kitasatospora setae KM-6054]